MKKAVLSFEDIRPKRTHLVEGGVYQPKSGGFYYILGRVSSDELCLINLQSGNMYQSSTGIRRMGEVLQDFDLVSERIDISLC